MPAAELPSWVLDTNVVISGLLSAHAPPGHLIDMVVAHRLRLSFDDRIEAEYREVMARPKFRIDPERADAFLALLNFQDHVIAPPWRNKRPPDSDDTVFLEVAAATGSRILVTGNARHFPAAARGPVIVLTPLEAWRRFSVL